jgi:glycosyltransferase involved in cell wall biosynthesis
MKSDPMAGETRVSVLIPARNAAATIATTLASLAPDRGLIGEILLIDDASTDGTATIAAEAATRLRLPLRVLPVSVGNAGAARNVGIDASTGNWLYFLDADDVYLTGGIAALLEVGLCHPRTALVAGGYRRIVDGRLRREKTPATLHGRAGTDAERYLIGRMRSFPVGTVLVSRQAVGDHRFPEGLAYDEDTIFWGAMLTKAPAATIGRKIMVYNVSTERADARFTRRPKREYLRWRRALNDLVNFGVPPSVLKTRAGIIALKIARVHYARANYHMASRFLAAARAAPTSPSDAWRCLRYRIKIALALSFGGTLSKRRQRHVSSR